jgi:uncharacterized protein YcaQ
VAVRARRHFRCVYDLAERVHPEGKPASRAELEDSWLLAGLSGNGIASEAHLIGYWTAAELDAAGRKRVLERNRKKKRIVEIRVEGLRGPFYALPEHLESLARIPAPQGTTLICPFDSLLWQRKRAEDLLDFSYRVEIYVPPEKRQYGYYVLPILHEGRLVGRLDPKLHRQDRVLEIRSLHFEPEFGPSSTFRRALNEALGDLAEFLGAERVDLPPARFAKKPPWRSTTK